MLEAIIRISLSRCDEVPSRRSDSGKLNPISFGRITRQPEVGPCDVNLTGYAQIAEVARGGGPLLGWSDFP
jgi:hypothetical protein